MTPSSFPNTDSVITPSAQAPATRQVDQPADIIRALTPMFIALIGGLMGITVIFAPTNDKAAAYGVASAAIAGAAGLAQPYKEARGK